MIEQGARNNFRAFSCLIHRGYSFNWHHRIIAEKLEAVERGDIKRLMIFMPPRHGKSQEATINFPAWYLGRNIENEIITASYSGELAQEFGGQTREIIRDTPYQRIFGVSLKEDEKSRGRWKTDKGGSYTSVGVGGAVTGKGANVLIIDDPIKNREEADSKVYRDKVWNWYTSTAYTRLEKGGAVILILTRWHLDDLAGRLLKAMQNGEGDQWDIINFPAIATKDEEFRKKGEALWPEKYDIAELEKIKGVIGVYDFASLYQQTPIATENQEFKNEWFKEVTEETVDRLETRKFLTIDTAYSERDSADFCGFAENYVDTDNNWNIKAYKMKLNPAQFISYLFTLQEKRGFETIGIEKTAYLVGLKPSIDAEMRKRNLFFTIKELDHNQRNKETRIRGLIPRYSSGNIYHIKGNCEDLEEELITFPKAIHDDVSDALAYQLDLAEKPHEYSSFKQAPLESRSEYDGL